jgi:hypothetical protein
VLATQTRVETVKVGEVFRVWIAFELGAKEFTGVLDVVYERKGLKDDTKAFVLSNWKVIIAITEMARGKIIKSLRHRILYII